MRQHAILLINTETQNYTLLFSKHLLNRINLPHLSISYSAGLGLGLRWLTRADSEHLLLLHT